MTQQHNIGILSVGTFLPEEVRTNDWWPQETVERWSQKAIRGEARATDSDTLSPGAQRIMEAQARLAADPFRGAVERRVMDSSMVSSDMEVLAARDAISRAGIDPSQIDLVLTHSVVPDYLSTNTAATTHAKLGLSRRCFSLSVEAACNSFLLQLSLAAAMLESGRARYALLVQSCAVSRLLPYEDAYSTMFGDGATAVVVGPSLTGAILGADHRTDGDSWGVLVTGHKGAPWHEEGKPILYSANLAGAHRNLLTSSEMAVETVNATLADAHLDPSDVDFYAAHQATCWLRETTLAALKLPNARSLDTYPWTGSLFASNIPFVLATAERESLLKPGDRVLMFSPGSGCTASSTIVRWGQ